jgi:hypothetical protein
LCVVTLALPPGCPEFSLCFPKAIHRLIHSLCAYIARTVPFGHWEAPMQDRDVLEVTVLDVTVLAFTVLAFKGLGCTGLTRRAPAA